MIHLCGQHPLSHLTGLQVAVLDRDRQRQRELDRDTDRQTDRQRESDKQRERQIEREAETVRLRQTERD